MISDNELVKLAVEARKSAYCPYSGFQVGAALLCEDGTVYTGCNVENASYGAAICAERCAAVKAVSDSNVEFVKLAVAGDGDEFCMPCGICRQFLSEFTDNLVVLCSNERGEWKEYGFDELLPNAFKL